MRINDKGGKKEPQGVEIILLKVGDHRHDPQKLVDGETSEVSISSGVSRFTG
jgi:hypothetical protein